MESATVMLFHYLGYSLVMPQRSERWFHWYAIPIRDGCVRMCGSAHNLGGARDGATKWRKSINLPSNSNSTGKSDRDDCGHPGPGAARRVPARRHKAPPKPSPRPPPPCPRSLPATIRQSPMYGKSTPRRQTAFPEKTAAIRILSRCKASY